MRKINSYIKEKRNNSITQEEMARLLNVSHRTYQRYETDAPITPELLIEIAKILKLDLKEAMLAYMSDFVDINDIVKIDKKSTPAELGESEERLMSIEASLYVYGNTLAMILSKDDPIKFSDNLGHLREAVKAEYDRRFDELSKK